MHELGIVFNLAMHAPRRLADLEEGGEQTPALTSEMMDKKWWGKK